MFCLTPGTAVRAADSDSSAVSNESVVELDVTNANMLAVVELLRKPGGTQFIISGDTKLFRPVTVHLRSPLSQMLKYVAASAGATISKDEYGVYTIRPIDPNAPVKSAIPMVSTSDTPPATQQPDVAARPALSNAPLRWETINLQYVEPTFILSVLNSPDRNVTSPYGTEFRPAPLLVGAAPQPQLVMTDPWSNGNKPASTSQTQTNGASTVNTQPGVPLGGNDFTGGANRAETRLGVPAQQFPAPGGGGAAPGAAGGRGVDLRPAGVDQIIAITEQNTLLVRGTSQGIAELRDIIMKLDVPAKQVQIKVEFVTASVGMIDQLGISWDLIPYPSIETGFFPPGPSGSGSTFLTYSHGNMVAKLAALLSSSNGKVIASPMITLTNNIQGSITVTDQIPYSQTTTIAQGNGNALQAQTTSFLSVPTGLTARARINGDNSVTLQLTPQLSKVTASSGTGPPQVSSQTVQTIRTVGNGETLVLGGLVQKTDATSRFSYPILSDLPIIGSLFRSRNNSQSDTELLLFVTPTILPIPGSTTTGETPAPIQEGVMGTIVGNGVTP
ncbi:MAG TPA: hypothetical protein VGK19_00270 [Capsulimonadaceae bacterium]|jgi:hypothetical protein